jgi:uncharacterized Zn finger protein (UPF0148 family)
MDNVKNDCCTACGSSLYWGRLGKSGDIMCQVCGLPIMNQMVDNKQDSVKHPKHYTSHPSGIEVIEITKHMNFCLGNAIKYILRCDEKGKPVEDLKKAIQYLEFEIERREAK